MKKTIALFNSTSKVRDIPLWWTNFVLAQPSNISMTSCELNTELKPYNAQFYWNHTGMETMVITFETEEDATAFILRFS